MSLVPSREELTRAAEADEADAIKLYNAEVEIIAKRLAKGGQEDERVYRQLAEDVYHDIVAFRRKGGPMPSREELTRAAEANEDKRLRAQVDRYVALLNGEIADNEKLRDENERLRAALQRANCPVRGPGPD